MGPGSTCTVYRHHILTSPLQEFWEESFGEMDVVTNAFVHSHAVPHCNGRAHGEDVRGRASVRTLISVLLEFSLASNINSDL
jgi:hypothetical protein